MVSDSEFWAFDAYAAALVETMNPDYGSGANDISSLAYLHFDGEPEYIEDKDIVMLSETDSEPVQAYLIRDLEDGSIAFCISWQHEPRAKIWLFDELLKDAAGYFPDAD